METQLADNSRQSPLEGDRLRRIATATLLIAVAAASWAVTVRRMQGMDMGPGTDLGGLGWFAVVWATMMAAMMLPSLVPMALTYARAGGTGGGRSPGAGTAAFVCGYLLTWLGAGLLAYGFIQGVRALNISWLAWDRAGQYVAGGVILGAALFAIGVMNVTWMIVVAALVAMEKLLPWDGVAISGTALFLVVLAVLVVVAPHQVPAMTIPG